MQDFSSNPAFVIQYGVLFKDDPVAAATWLRDAGGYLPSAYVRALCTATMKRDKAVREGKGDPFASVQRDRLAAEAFALRITRELETGDTSPLAGKDVLERRDLILAGKAGLDVHQAHEHLEELGLLAEADLLKTLYGAQMSFERHCSELTDVVVTQREDIDRRRGEALEKLDATALRDSGGRLVEDRQYLEQRKAIVSDHAHEADLAEAEWRRRSTVAQASTGIIFRKYPAHAQMVADRGGSITDPLSATG